MRRATVAIEDERFYKHDGVDLNAIVRAGIKNLESGKTVQGGSTITQQLVRALYIKDPKRDFARKIREAKLASELEDEHSKTWILHNYLNTVPYGTVGGRTAIGVEAAAVTFFDKHAKNLTLDESALLAGLPQAPSQYNPFRNPEAAIGRRNEVLRQMADEPLHHAGGGRRGDRRAAEAEARHALHHAPRAVLLRLRAGAADRALRRRARAPRRPAHPYDDRPRSCRSRADGDQRPARRPGRTRRRVVSIDPTNGYIRAMAASGTYQTRNFNLAAQGHRQPGSAFKTMVLTAAIRAGVDPDSHHLHLEAAAHQRPRVRASVEVKTYGHTYIGTMT